LCSGRFALAAPARPAAARHPPAAATPHTRCLSRPETKSRVGLVLESPQQVRPAPVAQLAQRFGLDLPDALAGDREVHADLLERVVPALPDAEAEPEHLGLARREGAERA